MSAEEQRATFAVFNAGVRRARADYERMPSRACMAKDCSNLHDDDGGYCQFHRSEWKAACRRMAKLRKTATP
jgi:hypothetical protein